MDGFFQEWVAIDLENADADFGVLSEQLGDRVVLNCPVRSISQDADGVSLETDRGPFRGRLVIVAIPPLSSSARTVKSSSSARPGTNAFNRPRMRVALRPATKRTNS